MKEEKFIQKHTSSWIKLKELIESIEKHGYKKLNSGNLREFLHLFRQTSHHLAYARTHFPNSDVVLDLNALLGRAHNYIYVAKKHSLKDSISFVLSYFPRKFLQYKTFIFSGFLVFFAGFLLSLIMVLIDSNNAYYFLPKEMIENINWDMDHSGWDYPLMSSYIMVNNISVSFRAFVLGITLGLGTIYVLFFNGALLGGLTGLVYLFGNPTNYWSLILPHGIIELTAIFIAGAAGLLVAKGILLPGEYSRKHSIVQNSKEAIPLVLGTVVMLIVAGLIEGFFTPLAISPYIKLVFAGFTAVLLIIYFSMPIFKSDD